MQAYRQLLAAVFNKQVDFDSDALGWTLHTSSYTPNKDTHRFVSDLTNELTTGGGYTASTASAPALAISSPVIAYVAANSWTVQRANSTAYNVGDVIRPIAGNGFVYRCVTAGTSAGTTTTLGTTLGLTTTDGTAVFENVGSGVMTFTCANPSWASATFGPCRYAVLSDRTSGSNATNPVLGYIDFGSDKTGGGGVFQITLNATQGVITYFQP